MQNCRLVSSHSKCCHILATTFREVFQVSRQVGSGSMSAESGEEKTKMLTRVRNLYPVIHFIKPMTCVVNTTCAASAQLSSFSYNKFLFSIENGPLQGHKNFTPITN